MFKKHQLGWLVSTLLATSAVGFTAQVQAQEQEEQDSAETVERINVTGSRLSRADLETPAPTVSLGTAEIQRFGTTDLGSILAELPAIGATDTLVGNSDSNELAGISSADLRRLGASRTLVLVNGKRHVAGAPGSAQVDLSTIPAALIKRVDVVTGGASAIYGSDAVSGVINIILKDDFEGAQVNFNGSDSLTGVGSQNHTLNFFGGVSTADGKGNATVFVGYERVAEVMSEDVRQLQDWGTIENPDDTGEEDGIPDRLRVPNVGSEFISRNGVIYPLAGSGYPITTFDNAGNPVVQVERSGTNSFAFGSFPDGCEYCFFTEDYENILPGTNKINLGTTFNYELSDSVRFSTDVKYTTSDISQQFQPSFSFFEYNLNIEDNAYLPNDIRQDLLDAGESVLFNKFFDGLGNRSADNKRDLFRYVAAFDGEFSVSDTPVEWELFYGYGQTTNERKTLNDLIPSNFEAALDSVIDPATGEPACRSAVPDAQPQDYESPALVNPDQCVPFNPFGLANFSAEAGDYVSADVTRNDKITQEYYGISAVTDTAEFLNLPGGPIGIAFGYEFREETSETVTDEFTKAGFLSNAATPDAFGSFDVTEYFAEVSLPLLADVPFAKELTLDAAFRAADYSHAGQADAWKTGFKYAPIDDLTLRGTYGVSVRAPNVAEAFDPQSPGFANISDPCDADNIDDDNDRRANCLALGIPDGFEANDNVSIDVLSGGNPDLISEESTSFTLGVVVTPSQVKDFSISVDYYDIEIEDAISFLGAQTILDNCVDATGSPDLNFCNSIDRDPSTNDVTLVRSGYINASAFTVQGYDVDVRYRTDLAAFDLPGVVNLNLFANHLAKLEIFEFQTRPDEINVEQGEVGDPEWQFRLTANYQLDDLSVNWTTRFIDKSALYDVTPVDGGSPEDGSPAFVDSIYTHDLSARYAVNEQFSIGVGVRNLFDEVPPGYNRNSLYDLIGRRGFINTTYNF